MCSVESARKAATEKAAVSDGAGLSEAAGGTELSEGLVVLLLLEEASGFSLRGLEEARKERREARVKKRRGAAEEEERREEGEGEESEGEETEGVEGEEIRDVVGSKVLWRWRRFDSISKKDSSMICGRKNCWG